MADYARAYPPYEFGGGAQLPEYRRRRVPGGTYFFTVNLLDRRSDLLVREVDLLREAVADTVRRRPFHIDAWVLLPEHMHCVWTLPPGDADYSGRWRAVKTYFAKRLEAGEARSAVRERREERGVWQRRFWEHAIRDDEDFAAHVDYVHFNPVRHGLVARVADWRFSSFHRAVARGEYPAEWGGSGGDEGEFGER